MTFPKWANTNVFILTAYVKQISIKETPIKGLSNFLLLQDVRTLRRLKQHVVGIKNSELLT